MNLRKATFVVLFTIIAWSMLWGATNSNGLQVTGMKLIRKGTEHQFKRVSDAEFGLEISCTEDTGSVDIVFVLDTTGSMGTYISSAVDHIVEFAETMATTGFDYAFGIVTYGDGFNFPHGYTPTQDVDTFISWMTMGSSGGGDTPETALDGIMAAVDSINWRTGALKVIILLTDACFCEEGDGCYDCTSIWDADTVARRLLDDGFMFFAATRNPLYSSSCCDGAYSLWWYQNISDSTGGSWFDITESFASIYTDIIELLGTFQVIQVDVANYSGSDLDSIFAYITLGSCIELLYGENPALRPSLPDGDTIHFFWRVNYSEGCTGPDACFEVSLSSADGSYSDLERGCFFIPNCWCSPVIAGNISPEIGVWSACDPQAMVIGIYDEDGVNESSIVFDANGTEITYPDPSLTYDDGTLTYLPDTGAFISGDSVYYELVDAEDETGCTLSTPASGWFLVDLDPPEFSDEQPEDGIMVGGIPSTISLIITDEYAGVDENTIYLIVDGTDTFTVDSTRLTFSDSTLQFDPIGLYSWGAGDTVEICVYSADLVDSTYCGPNGDTFCWEFMVDKLHLFFEDTIVNAGDNIVYPLFADDPARFSIYDYEMQVRYNPAVIRVDSVTTNGTASDGFTLDWDTLGGIITITASNTSPVGASSFFLNLHLHILDNVSGGAFTNMQLTEGIFDSGRVDYWADDGIILVNWSQTQWVHDLIFFGNDTVTGGYLDPMNLAIGCGYAATSGWDPAYDIHIPIPPPSQTDAYILLDDPDYPAIRRLGRSIQNSFELPVVWYIVTQAVVGSLYWSPRYFPPGIFTLNGYIDMKRDSIYHYSENETLQIVYSQPEIGEGTIEGCPGWNLLSLPTSITVSGWTSAIDEIIFGPLEYDARIRTYVNNDPPRLGFGFWVFAMNEFTSEIGGIPITSISIPVYRGWNLIGSISSDSITYHTDPSGIMLTDMIFEWSCETGAYQLASEIESGKGYWIFCTQDGVLHLE